MNRPDEKILTHNGIAVAVWFPEEGVAVVMPMFGGYYAPEEEKKKYNRAANVVKRRLKKLGFSIDG